MDLTFDPQDALPFPELVNGEPSAATPPGTLADSSQNQNSAIQGPRQRVTNLALTQGWSFAAAAADRVSRESASLGAVFAQPQGLVPGLPLSDTLRSEESNTETGSGDLAPTGLLNLIGGEGEPAADNLQTPRSRHSRLWTRGLSSEPRKRVQTMKMT